MREFKKKKKIMLMEVSCTGSGVMFFPHLLLTRSLLNKYELQFIMGLAQMTVNKYFTIPRIDV